MRYTTDRFGNVLVDHGMGFLGQRPPPPRPSSLPPARPASPPFVRSSRQPRYPALQPTPLQRMQAECRERGGVWRSGQCQPAPPPAHPGQQRSEPLVRRGAKTSAEFSQCESLFESQVELCKGFCVSQSCPSRNAQNCARACSGACESYAENRRTECENMVRRQLPAEERYTYWSRASLGAPLRIREDVERHCTEVAQKHQDGCVGFCVRSSCPPDSEHCRASCENACTEYGQSMGDNCLLSFEGQIAPAERYRRYRGG